ncbi:ribonuclease H-like domain-containing protein [Candidatus Woesearchaeota archaeon]|nr:ribonuclease H-like domain-containing protein [Candidatus Woesearchaeota archaeon]
MKEKLVKFIERSGGIEELIKKKEAFKIPLKSNTTIFPFDEVKEKLNNFFEIYKDSPPSTLEETKRLMNLNNNGFHLASQVEFWAELIEGKRTFGKGMNIFGYDFGFRLREADVVKIIRDNISIDYLIEVHNNIKYPLSFKDLIKDDSKKAIRAKNYIKNNNNINIRSILDKSFPEIVGLTGKTAYEILYDLVSFDEARDELKDRLYSGEKLDKNHLRNDIFGRKIFNFLSRKKVEILKNGKKVVLTRPSDLIAYTISPLLSGHDIVPDKPGTIKSAATLLEKLITFSFSIISKYDPELSNFSELKNFGGSLNKVFTSYGKRALNLGVKKIYPKNLFSKECREKIERVVPDGRLVFDDSEDMLEIKTAQYIFKNDFYESVSKFNNFKYWSDGKSIGKKILFVNNANGDKESIIYLCNRNNWKIIFGDDFLETYNKSIDLLFEKDDDFHRISVMNDKETLKKAYDSLLSVPHIEMRRPNKYKLKKTSELIEKNIKYLKGFEKISKTRIKRYCELTKFKLSDFSSFYDHDLFDDSFSRKDMKGVVFYDSETTGFLNQGSLIVAHSIAKLYGNDVFAYVYFVKNPYNEKLILKKTNKKLKSAKKIVTFNGNVFDDKLYAKRNYMNLLREGESISKKDHLDLRKLYWKTFSELKGYASGSVQDYERGILGAIRSTFFKENEMSGKDVPLNYGAYLLGEKHEDLKHMFLHTALDVFTLAYMYKDFLNYDSDLVKKNKIVEEQLELGL